MRVKESPARGGTIGRHGAAALATGNGVRPLNTPHTLRVAKTLGLTSAILTLAMTAGRVEAEDASPNLPPAPAQMSPAPARGEAPKVDPQVQPATTATTPTATATTAAPTETAAAAPAAPVYYGDAYGFTDWLNSVRAQYGLGAVGHDPNLSSWAAVNNNHQNAYGMGHHVMGPARRQNSGMGASTTVFQMWMASPAHRAALLDPSISWIGIAASGAYWTFNAY